MTTSKTKKEHYVPQCYLNAWCIPGTHQINVYDKNLDSYRVNNIADVATERYFYDVNPNDIYSKEYLNELKSRGISWDREEDSQGLEHFFSEEIEGPLSEWLNSTLNKVCNITPWHIDNCFFIKKEERINISAYLAIQFLRTKHIRNGILDNADCLTQLLEDIGAPKSTIEDYGISKDLAKNTHIQMLLDPKAISDVMNCFIDLTWVLGINRTNKKLFTSDNPIGIWGHIKDSVFPTNGIASRGVEVFYPVSPEIVLIMIDASYHTYCRPYERRYVEITNVENIDYYNSIITMQAERFVFSSEKNMSLIDEMKQKAPDIFKQPHVKMEWGNKTFYPRR